MQFAQPLWLFAGAAVCVLLAWQYRRFDLQQRRALAQFAATRLQARLISSVPVARRRIKRILFALGVAFLFLALARPQAGFEWQETHRKGLELLFAVDTSKSMLSQDVKPDRLTRAKMAVTDLVAKLNGDGVGLIAFAGDAFLQCPVTLDYDAFRECIDALDVNVIPKGGTDIAAAIHEAEAVFKTRTAAEKVLILMTDGEDLGGEAITAAADAAQRGVKIFTVGIGSADGALIPIPNGHGGTDFAKDENGSFVKSRLDKKALQQIAEATGGIYQPLGPQSEGLTAIYEHGLSAFTRHDLASRQAKVPLEKFHWALLAALVCFVSEMLIGTRSKRSARKPAAIATNKRFVLGRAPVAATAAAFVLLATISGTHAATPQSAEQEYAKGEFAQAQKDYAETAAKSPAKAELHFNTGAAAYQAGDYAQASSAFHDSLKTEQIPLQESAYYNLANTQFRLGQKTEHANPQATIKTWEEAVKSYDAALQIASDDRDAKRNRDLVRRKLDQLKKQEEQKQQDQKKKDDPQNKDQQDPKNDSKDQQNGKNDSKDQKGNAGKDKKDSGDGKGAPKDEKDDSKPGKSADSPKNSPQDQKDNDQKKPEESKDKSEDGKDHQGEPKDQKDGSKPQHGQDQKNPSAKPDSPSANAAEPKPAEPAKKPSQADAKAANGEPSETPDASNAAEERREPGQMTREEARQLLDALKGDERKLPAVSQRGRAATPNDHKILKDW